MSRYQEAQALLLIAVKERAGAISALAAADAKMMKAIQRLEILENDADETMRKAQKR